MCASNLLVCLMDIPKSIKRLIEHFQLPADAGFWPMESGAFSSLAILADVRFNWFKYCTRGLMLLMHSFTSDRTLSILFISVFSRKKQRDGSCVSSKIQNTGTVPMFPKRKSCRASSAGLSLLTPVLTVLNTSNRFKFCLARCFIGDFCIAVHVIPAADAQHSRFKSINAVKFACF